MRTRLLTLAIGVASVALSTTTALGQATRPACDALKAGAPQKVEGQVVNVDARQGKVTVRTSDGKTQDFTTSPDAAREFRVGDRIEAQLRGAANC